MEKHGAKRIHLKRGQTSKRQLDKWRNQIADELPDLMRRNKLADIALKEKTFSGALRRAIHKHRLSPMKIAEKAGMTWIELDDFLTGEKTLLSNTIDRLVDVVQLKLPTDRLKHKPRTAKAS